MTGPTWSPDWYRRRRAKAARRFWRIFWPAVGTVAAGLGLIALAARFAPPLYG